MMKLIPHMAGLLLIPVIAAETPVAVGAPMRHEDALHALAVSPDGRFVATGAGDNTARVWDAGTGKPVTPPLRHDGNVQSVAFGPDGKTLLTGSVRSAHLWDVSSAKPVGEP